MMRMLVVPPNHACPSRHPPGEDAESGEVAAGGAERHSTAGLLVSVRKGRPRFLP